MSDTERLSTVHIRMDARTGDLVLRYERYVPKSGWMDGQCVIAPEVLRVMQDDWAATAKRNPDMKPETVTESVLERWALAHIRNEAMRETA